LDWALALLVLLAISAAHGLAFAAGPEPRAVGTARLPLWVKLFNTAFACVLVPVYWAHYGPANFLWFSDIALFLAVAALWREDAFLASVAAVAVTPLELAWVVDFLLRLAGLPGLGLASYMFEPERPLYLRGLSLFHLWLPFLLLWLVWRLGFDRRAWLVMTGVACVVLPVCYFLTDPARNINWVFGPGQGAQTWMAPGLYLSALMLAFPLGVYLPTHLLLCLLFPPPQCAAQGDFR
jgi:hypothetical protein